ncbi:hypothetical protein PUMCH_003179 [Australozyma saopauloensis]|uniref:Thioredoxin domain-containing protein n=1 Tax=Australozyma saopauloensis TaxID=291208 RepID=A0AAX4HBT9_9ASCO|nr:hypothetical protein PUMCH_003179 [[Candida] saopauloensis]
MLRTATRFNRVSRVASPALRRFNSSKVIEIENLKQFQSTIGNKDKLSVVDFYATWCGPCKAVAPIFDKLAQELPEVEFARVDVDKAEDVAHEYAILAMPTFLMFQNGEKIESIVGANLGKIFSSIQKHSGVDLSTKNLR